MTNAPPPTNEFHIAFERSAKSGYVTTVKVTIEQGTMDVDESVRIDLADHPLYLQLQQYVRSNPR